MTRVWAAPTIGSTLLVTLVTLAAISVMAAYSLRHALPGIRMAHQNAAWQEARVAAEAGVDIAMHDLLLNATGFSPGAWTGWQEGAPPPIRPGSPPAPGLIPSLLKQPLLQTVTGVLSKLVTDLLGGNTVLPIPASTPAPGGGAVISSDAIFLDNVKVSATKGLPAEVDIQMWALTPVAHPHTRWYRIRSMGTCPLPPTAYEAPTSLDTPLRRFSLRNVRSSLKKDDVGAPTTIPLPNASRTIEVLIQPILAFELALWTSERLTLPNIGHWDIDSFDSTDPTKSAAEGLYPGRGSGKLQANGYVASSAPPLPGVRYGTAINVNGTSILGAVSTNGGDDPQTPEHENVAGARALDPGRIHDDFSRQMIPLVRPEGEFLPPLLGGIFATGPTSAPTIYSIHGSLRQVRILAPKTGAPGAVILMIDGDLDLADPLVIPPSVIAVLYVRGQITFQGNVNSGPDSSNRANQLIIFGDHAAPQHQMLRGIGAISICAAYYGPTTEVSLDGDVHWIGSLNAFSFRAANGGNGGIHYDESLATIGPTIGFRIARFVEDVRE